MQGRNVPGVDRREPIARPRAPTSDIGFLREQGIAPALLLQAEALARVEGSAASTCLLAHDLIDATLFYRLLARHLGLRLCEETVRPSAATRLDQAWVDGFLELEQGSTTRWLLAPQGADIAVVLAARESLRAAGAAFALVTPQRLKALLCEHFAGDIGKDASLDLARHFPAMCNAPGSSSASATRSRTLLGMTFALLGLTLSALLGIAFVIGNWLKLSACIAAKAPSEDFPALADGDLPTYTIIVALYQEQGVVADLAVALGAIDYPKSRLSVIFVIEADDIRTRVALQALALPQRFSILTAPAGTPRTKPRALNVALRMVTSEFVTIYDAEDRPSPRQLRAAVARFAELDDRTACLQASLAIDNATESWLTKLFALDYAALFDVTNPLLAAAGFALPLGGTSNHFRVATLKACHGWDAWNVTEDADLGIRLARLGYGVATLASDTFEEAPISMGAWLHQRRRWQKGWMQTALVHLRFPQAMLSDLAPARSLVATAWLSTMVIGPLFGPLLALAGLADMTSGGFFSPASPSILLLNTWILFVAVTGGLAMLAPVLVGLWRRRLWGCVIALPLLPLYLALISLAAWLALYDLVTAPYHWRKTTHGLTSFQRTVPL